MRLVLAAMPWQALQRPSLPVGLLHSLVKRDCPNVHVDEYHGGLHWAEHLSAGASWETVVEEYDQVAEHGVFNGLGDLIFAGCVSSDPSYGADALETAARQAEVDVGSVKRMRGAAADFIDAAADTVLQGQPDVVGLTSTFMQNIPSLALARRLKELQPEVRIVLGGANCEGPMGHALHRNYGYVDYVVRGEAEEVFPQLLQRLHKREPVDDLAGVCWRAGDRSVANPPATKSVPPSLLTSPTFDAWQRSLDDSPLREYVTPELVIEASRGCWWGEKHHCTFCGLNGALMAFRSKPAEKFWSELTTLVERHQILDVSVVDNILDMQYFHSLLPLMAETDWDLRVHFEIKSNLRADQIRALADAKIVMVQPGIESLNGRVLKLMDKGVSGAANVQTLRNCEDNHITVEWNYLYGFPGERAEDYQCVIDQMPALAHLQPPSGAVRIVLERYSPYFERPELGFMRREPLDFYRQAYNLDDSELFDLAYFFACDNTGIDDAQAVVLGKAIDAWRHAYPVSSLTSESDGEDLVIHDQRAGWTHRQHLLSDWQAAAYRILARRTSPHSLLARLEANGHSPAQPDVDAWLRRLRDDGLVFVDGEHWVALATSGTPAKVRSAPDPVEVLV